MNQMIELFLVIYLTSGTIKSFINFLDIQLPVDFTLLVAIAILVLVLKKNYKLHARFSQYYPMFAILVFYLWILFSLFYTSSKIYSFNKTLLFATNLIPIIVISIIDRFDIRLFFKYFIAFSIIYYIAYLPLLLTDLKYLTLLNQNIEEYAGSLYLTIGETLGASLVIISSNKEIFKSSRTRALVILMSIIGLLQIGARGPILFSFIVLLIQFIYKKIKENKIFVINKSNIRYLIIIIVSFFLLYFLVPSFHATIARTTYRLQLIIAGLSNSGSYGASIDARIRMYGDSERILQRLGWQTIIGSGIGSYGIEAYGIDYRAYPHNVFLEIFVELGAIGLILFIVFLAITLIIGKKDRSSMQYVLIYMFLNILKSSSLVDIRLLFILIMLHWYQKNAINQDIFETSKCKQASMN